MGRAGLVVLTVPHHYSSLKEVRTGTHTGPNSEAGAEAENMEECVLLLRSSWLAQPAFLQNPGPPVSGLMALPTMGWALPHGLPITNMPHRLTYNMLFRQILN